MIPLKELTDQNLPSGKASIFALPFRYPLTLEQINGSTVPPSVATPSYYPLSALRSHSIPSSSVIQAEQSKVRTLDVLLPPTLTRRAGLPAAG